MSRGRKQTEPKNEAKPLSTRSKKSVQPMKNENSNKSNDADITIPNSTIAKINQKLKVISQDQEYIKKSIGEINSIINV